MIHKNIISFPSTDGLLLHGMLYDSGNSGCVMHVHGLAGNFYSSTYHETLSQIYSKLGYNYLVFNNRGSEYIKQLKNTNTGESKYYGYTFELFEEADRDILGAVEYLKQNNYRSYGLQGHSSGCQKIIYTLSQHKLNPDFVILLSPCDDIGLAINNYSSSVFANKIAEAQAGTEILMPSDFFFDIPISRATFLSHFGPASKFNIFHYYHPDKPFTELPNNPSKTLVIFGEKDYVLDFDTVVNVFGKIPNYTIKIIPGSDHKYKGCEDELGIQIENYVKTNSFSK